MIINEFAKLCNCNPQTLRYYDSIDLLKPVNVDQYSGYRHYSAEQALQYLKIKKLQDAMFTIEEIRELLDANDDVIFEALSNKIAEQQAKLKKIEEIQKSYQKEIKMMKEKIEDFKKNLLLNSMEVDYKKEFGISKDEFFDIVNALGEMADESLVDETSPFEFDNDVENVAIALDGFELFYELIGFNTIKEAIRKIPLLENGKYFIVISCGETYSKNLAFSAVTVELLLRKFNTQNKIDLEFNFDFNSSVKFIKVYKKI